MNSNVPGSDRDRSHASGSVGRREALTTGGVVLAGALAGCLFGSGDDEDAYYEDESFVDEADEPDYDGYLDGIDYPGTVDWTDVDEAAMVVAVGTGREGMGYAPRSVRVEAGATVTWEWTGEGGRHDVVHVDGEFDSGELHESGATWEHSFEEPGEYAYFCTPHEHRNMKGGVEVV